MTDEEIRNAVTRYIIGGHESDNADCLHEMKEFGDPDLSNSEFSELMKRAYAIYRQAEVSVTYPGDQK